MAMKSSTCLAALTALLLSAPQAGAAPFSTGQVGVAPDAGSNLQLAQLRPDGAPGGGGGRGGGGGAATAPSGGGGGGPPPGAGGGGRGPDAGLRGGGAERREFGGDRRGGDARVDRSERRELRQERREDRRDAREERREDRREARDERRDDRRDRVINRDRDRVVDRDRLRDRDRVRDRDGVRDRDVRGRIGDWRRGDWRDHRRWRRGVLVIGGYDVWYDPAPTNIVVRYRGSNAWRRAMAQCYENYRSFNPRTGMYVTYGGESRLCPYLRPFVR